MPLLHTSVEPSLKNIVVATDFSPVSLSALNYILPIARESGSMIHIVHVIQPREMDIDGYVQAQRDLMRLEPVVGSIPHQIHLCEGRAWREVENLVRSEHIDLIVAGTSGKPGIKKFFLGSVADEIFRNATCPVLTIGSHISATDHTSPLAQILYVTKLFEDSHQGLQYAISLAHQHQSQLTLLHVVEQEYTNPSDHELLRAYHRLLRNLLNGKADGLSEKPVLRIETSKQSAARILEVAVEIKADLMVMDVHPEKPWAAHLHDRVYEIVSWANCPVLTVRTSTEPALSREEM